MSDKDLKPSHDLSKGDAAVASPFLHNLFALSQDHKSIRLARVDDLGEGNVSTRHFDSLVLVG